MDVSARLLPDRMDIRLLGEDLKAALERAADYGYEACFAYLMEHATAVEHVPATPDAPAVIAITVRVPADQFSGLVPPDAGAA